MSEQASTTTSRWSWVVRGVAALALVAVGWVLLTAWAPVVHGHPAYPVLLVLTVVVALLALWRARRPRVVRRGWRLAGRVVLVVLAVAWVAAMLWLRPFGAVQPALAAMRSDAGVTVTETATSIVLAPAGTAGDLGVFFQPGARVDARAYAAVLRPLAEAGHPVVIAKQPLGIAFLALPAFDAARSDHPEVARWVVGGHSLGGTVAVIQADDSDTDTTAPAVGLLLYASYPAGDVRASLTTAVESVSGSRDGLATPATIDASRANLPADTTFNVIEGGTHAQFGAYGLQPGDGTATISDDEARRLISAASLRFVDSLRP
ncbi:MAG TPA: alpha/beta hydrolase [Ornithinibacter sp.]|nr:alpha/beta hydrolase [Ornithinibacter sp.]